MEPARITHDVACARHRERLARSLAGYPSRRLRAACPLERLAARIGGRRRPPARVGAPLAS